MITVKMKIMPWPAMYGNLNDIMKSEIVGLLDKSYVIPVCYPENNIIGYVDPAGDIYHLNGFIYGSVTIPSRIFHKLNNPKDIEFSDLEVRLNSSGTIERILKIICRRKS